MRGRPNPGHLKKPAMAGRRNHKSAQSIGRPMESHGKSAEASMTPPAAERDFPSYLREPLDLRACAAGSPIRPPGITDLSPKEFIHETPRTRRAQERRPCWSRTRLGKTHAAGREAPGASPQGRASRGRSSAPRASQTTRGGALICRAGSPTGCRRSGRLFKTA